jgi:predicted DNA-binding transcriptional regulator AlpA
VADSYIDDACARLPARKVWERFGITDRTLDRWLSKPELEFPGPIIINKRRYFVLSEIVAWERKHAAGKATAAA